MLSYLYLAQSYITVGMTIGGQIEELIFNNSIIDYSIVQEKIIFQ